MLSGLFKAPNERKFRVVVAAGNEFYLSKEYPLNEALDELENGLPKISANPELYAAESPLDGRVAVVDNKEDECRMLFGYLSSDGTLVIAVECCFESYPEAALRMMMYLRGITDA